MEKKRTPFLDLHKKIITSGKGKMPRNGLCQVVTDLFDISDKEWEIWELLEPTSTDNCEMVEAGEDNVYWGSGSSKSLNGIYTPRRQTIILFCAALNDEL